MNLPEFRLYYNTDGSVLFYTCEKQEGNYLVIDQQTYLNNRFDVKVIDNQIVNLYNTTIITKLVPSNIGTNCCKDDISIVCEGQDTQKWKLKTCQI